MIKISVSMILLNRNIVLQPRYAKMSCVSSLNRNGERKMSVVDKKVHEVNLLEL